MHLSCRGEGAFRNVLVADLAVEAIAP